MFSNRLRKTAVAAAVVASVVGSGVMSAAAQDTTATPTTPSTAQDTTQTQPDRRMPGRGFARGLMGGGLLDVGPSGDLADSPIIAAIADALGVDVQTLVDDVQSGKSITELADEQGVDMQVVYDAVIAKHKEKLDAEVSTGYLTQEQADERLQNLTDNIAGFPLFATLQFPDPANQQGFAPGNRGPRGGGFPGGNGPQGWPNGGGFPGGNGPQGGPNGSNGPWGHPQGGQNGNGPWGNQQGGPGMNGPQDGSNGINGPQGNQPPAPPASNSTPEATPTSSASA